MHLEKPNVIKQIKIVRSRRKGKVEEEGAEVVTVNTIDDKLFTF